MRKNINQISVARLLEKVIEIAELNEDHALKKWARLELEGYYRSNKYLEETDVVPEYREIPGEHRDEYDRPFIISDPELGFINSTRLRQSVPEIEEILSRQNKNKHLIIRDPHAIKAINDNLGVTVTKFIFNPAVLTGVLNSIKEEAIERSKKYISRSELMEVDLKSTDASVEFNIPTNITLSWLWKNIPLNWWWFFFTLLIGAFSCGVIISGIPQVKNILRYIPGYKVDIILPPQTASLIEKQVTKLVEAHNFRISDLQKQLLEMEKLGVNSFSHRDSAERIKEIMREENNNFQNELKSLKDLYKLSEFYSSR